MMAAAQTLLPLLEKCRAGSSWHLDPTNYNSGTGGTVTLASAWFQLGKGVSTLPEMILIGQLTSYDYKDILPPLPPQVAAIFESADALNWLNQIADSNSISSVILAVIHPDLYSAGQKTLNVLWQSSEIHRQDVLRCWNSVFSGISVIFGGTVSAHRDSQSRYHWYDLLITLGHYQGCKLNLPGVGLSLNYGPGTVVGLSGMVLQHQVSKFEGERVSYAYFMRDNVHDWAKVPAGSWMRTGYYE